VIQRNIYFRKNKDLALYPNRTNDPDKCYKQDAFALHLTLITCILKPTIVRPFQRCFHVAEYSFLCDVPLLKRIVDGNCQDILFLRKTEINKK
jgi:hypothetical protein